MSDTGEKIYEFKIVLEQVFPTIWRQIQVPENFTLGQLSDAILSTMGWCGSHIHQFCVKNPDTKREEIFVDKKREIHDFCVTTMSEDIAKISKYFVDSSTKATYIYDMGDDWTHEITLVKKIAADSNVKYPKCVDGKRKCPPEDCGGARGYMDLLRVREKMNLTENEEKRLEHYGMLEADGYDPDNFKPEDVIFVSHSLMDEKCCIC